MCGNGRLHPLADFPLDVQTGRQGGGEAVPSAAMHGGIYTAYCARVIYIRRVCDVGYSKRNYYFRKGEIGLGFIISVWGREEVFFKIKPPMVEIMGPCQDAFTFHK